jgi:alginate O-acetyltransferase complex protein AlgI
MMRGAVQLLLYRLDLSPEGPSNAPRRSRRSAALATTMVMTYLLYLRVSGQFHIIIGLLHLFGYDLPETHRKYLLARSLTDFWRRINIYWKDFMVKLVYFPPTSGCAEVGRRAGAGRRDAHGLRRHLAAPLVPVVLAAR